MKRGTPVHVDLSNGCPCDCGRPAQSYDGIVISDNGRTVTVQERPGSQPFREIRSIVKEILNEG